MVGEAGDGPGAVEAGGSAGPDVVLLDVQLPGIDGFGVAELLPPRAMTAPVVVLISSREAGVYGPRIARSSAAGFLAKRELSGVCCASCWVEAPCTGGWSCSRWRRWWVWACWARRSRSTGMSRGCGCPTWWWGGCCWVRRAACPHRRDRGSGVLLGVTGLAWFLGFSSATLYLHRGPLVHLIVAFAGWRARSRLDLAGHCGGYLRCAGARGVAERSGHARPGGGADRGDRTGYVPGLGGGLCGIGSPRVQGRRCPGWGADPGRGGPDGRPGR